MAKIISGAVVFDQLHPLIKPYKLSFTELSEYLSIVVTLSTEDGETVQGEVVPLPGYSDVGPNEIKAHLDGCLGLVVGKSAQGAIEELPPVADHFLDTALRTALDKLILSWVDEPSPREMKYVQPTSSDKVDHLRELLSDSNQTIKLKLLGELAIDQRALSLLKDYPSQIIRCDANQAYSVEDCKMLFRFIAENGLSDQIKYIEQPIDAKDWEGLEDLCSDKNYHPIMLDEMVVTDEDLLRGASLKIPFVKLKLYKQGGIQDCLRQARLAKEHGMDVIFGNGVATDLANSIENKLIKDHPELFDSVSEANGFLKLKN